jgi:RNA polymerase sigma factor (sigma-70 family)
MNSSDNIILRDFLPELYQFHAKELMSFANSILRNPDDAQEIVQELFCLLYEKYSEKEIQRSTVRAFLFVSVKNSALNFIKKSKKTVPLTDTHAIPDPLYNAIDNNMTETVISDYVRSALSSLHCELFNLRIVHGLKWEEIATITGIPRSSAHREFETLTAGIRRKFPDVF